MDRIDDLKERLYRLMKEKAYHEGEIKLASGKMSHYYIDARAVTLSSEGAYLVGSIIFDLVKDLNIAAVGGPHAWSRSYGRGVGGDQFSKQKAF